MRQKPIEAGQVFDHPDAMAEHEQGIERATIELEDVGTLCVFDPALDHDLHRLRTDVYGGNSQAARLQDQAMEPGAGADIQHVTPRAVQGRHFNREELLRWAKEVAHRERVLGPVLTPNDQLGSGVAPELGAQGQPVRDHRVRIHGVENLVPREYPGEEIG